MENIEVQGEVKLVSDVMTFGSGFTKQEIRVEVGDGQYPQMIPIEFTKDNIEKLANIKAGDNVKVVGKLQGREHNDRCYLSIWGFGVDVLGAAQPAAPAPDEDPDLDVPF